MGMHTIYQRESFIKKRTDLRMGAWHTPVCGGKTGESTAKETVRKGPSNPESEVLATRWIVSQRDSSVLTRHPWTTAGTCVSVESVGHWAHALCTELCGDTQTPCSEAFLAPPRLQNHVQAHDQEWTVLHGPAPNHGPNLSTSSQVSNKPCNFASLYLLMPFTFSVWWPPLPIEILAIY